MTEVHSCSYYCDRPECIKAQRGELRNQLEAQRDALLEVLMLCQQAGLHKHILNTGESLANVVDAAIKQAEEKQK